MTRVFVSYSHTDANIAKRLAGDLKIAHLDVWIDEDGLRIGDNLVASIQKGIGDADFLCVLLSEASVSSAWVTQEFTTALHGEIDGNEIRVLPIVVGDCEIPPFLAGKLFADLRNLDNYDAQLARLLSAIGTDAPTNTTKLLIDQSFDQHRWYGEPTLEGGYSAISRHLTGGFSCYAYQDGYRANNALHGVQVLILPTPFRSIVSDEDYGQIVRWVQRGGGLLLLGFYLMEAHHQNNTNHLLRRLGVEFRHDLFMPLGRESFQECMAQSFAYQDRKLWVTTDLEGDPDDHPIIKGVYDLAITSSCTVETAERPDLSVHTSEDVAVFHAKGYKDPESGRMVRLTDYVLERRGPATFLSALRYGQGRVVAIGSWKIFLNEFLDDQSFGNAALLRNCVSWLAST